MLKWVLIGTGALAALFVIGLIAAPDEETSANSEAASAPGEIIELDAEDIDQHKRATSKDVSEFRILETEDDHRVWIEITYSDLWDDKSVVEKAARDAQREIRREQRTHPEGGVGGVLLNYYIPSTDRFGNETTSYAFRLIYDEADISRMNIDNLTYSNLLDLASLENVKPIAKKGLSDWCAENGMQAKRFCTATLE